jgi:hypothetical protein
MSEPIIISQPREGFYRTRLLAKGPWVGVMIWWGKPIVDGETQDRAPRWCAAVDGKTDKLDENAGCHVPLEVHDVWPWCCDEKIDHWEFGFMKNRARWARAHAPDHPDANPRRPIDLGRMKPLIGGKR